MPGFPDTPCLPVPGSVILGAFAKLLPGVAMLTPMEARPFSGLATPAETITDRLLPFLAVNSFIGSSVCAGEYPPAAATTLTAFVSRSGWRYQRPATEAADVRTDVRAISGRDERQTTGFLDQMPPGAALCHRGVWKA